MASSPVIWHGFLRNSSNYSTPFSGQHPSNTVRQYNPSEVGICLKLPHPTQKIISGQLLLNLHHVLINGLHSIPPNILCITNKPHEGRKRNEVR